MLKLDKLTTSQALNSQLGPTIKGGGLSQFKALAAVAGLGHHVPLPEEIADSGDNFPLVTSVGGDRGDKVAE
jgi:hypothetical protein